MERWKAGVLNGSWCCIGDCCSDDQKGCGAGYKTGGNVSVFMENLDAIEIPSKTVNPMRNPLQKPISSLWSRRMTSLCPVSSWDDTLLPVQSVVGSTKEASGCRCSEDRRYSQAGPTIPLCGAEESPQCCSASDKNKVNRSGWSVVRNKDDLCRVVGKFCRVIMDVRRESCVIERRFWNCAQTWNPEGLQVPLYASYPVGPKDLTQNPDRENEPHKGTAKYCSERGGSDSKV